MHSRSLESPGSGGLDSPMSSSRRFQLLPGRRRSNGRRFWPRFMRLTRRTHLYSGLFLVPWVVLYGVTGYLFNHPSHFSTSTSERTQLHATDLTTAAFPELPSAFEMAAAVVASLNKGASEDDDRDHGFSLAKDTSASLTSRFLFTGGAGRGESGPSYTVDVDADRRTGRLSKRAGRTRPADRPRFSTRRDVPVAANSVADAKAAAVGLLALHGYDVDNLRVRRAPLLRFRLVEKRGDEELAWDATYRLDRRELSARASETSTGPGWRRYLLRLHTAHTYPSNGGPRWWWAIMVDIMAASMVVWAVSGLLMWWQMRNLRRIGLVVIGACAIAATVLGLGMYEGML